MQTDPKLPDDWDPLYLPDDGFPRELPPIDWSMHQPEGTKDDLCDSRRESPVDIPPFPPYSYEWVRRALEDGEYEIVSVEIADD